MKLRSAIGRTIIPAPVSSTHLRKALARPIKPLGEWNTLEITLDGPRTVVFLNSVKVTDFKEGDPVPPKPPGSIDPDRGPRQDAGYIGLQNHPGDPVYFQEISLTPL